jgi:DNA segregation ATPase FtsK/SpoIIIE, S-DNA-T family
MTPPHRRPRDLFADPGRPDAAETDVDPEPLVLPDVPSGRHRSALPIVASVVPVAAAVGLWAVTGSWISLWFAALGPLIAVATVADSARTARRERRALARERGEAFERVGAALDRRHAAERGRRRSVHPDVAGLVRHDRVWSSGIEPDDVLVVGSGDSPSRERIGGGAGDPEAARLRARAAVLTDSPVVVPFQDGVAVTGPPRIARAVLRALVLQLCLRFGPDELRVVGGIDGEDWIDALPHRRRGRGRTLAVCGPGEAAPTDVDIVLALAAHEGRPPRCAAVITVTGVAQGVLDRDGRTQPITLECVGRDQADALADAMQARDLRAGGPVERLGVVHLGHLLGPVDDSSMDELGAGRADRSTLAAVIGVETDRRATPVSVDLVGDGPHAVVCGMTGTGKSELLVTWVTALCATRSPTEVGFLLADFKGGTAFDGLADLPHVTGVITDLDGTGARRAIESLRAELRWREQALVRAGARDIRDDRVQMPRLVVVVDEFAALVQAHPELQAVFTDVAARGRALGIHLILGTQRVAGVVRDALLANCPLRVSLRVADAADSRAVIGTDGAAQLPGGADGRGVALIRRAADPAPQRIRVALTDGMIVRAVAARQHGSASRRPWLPDLPTALELTQLRRTTTELSPGDILLGLVDEPEHQRQVPVVLDAGSRGLAVVGGAGAGRTTALVLVAAQLPATGRLTVGPDPESAWDDVGRLVDGGIRRGTTVIIDDLDALLARFPPEYAHTMADRLEQTMRDAGDLGHRFVVSAQRLTGPVARLVELLPARAVLRTSSRAEHLAAGGDPQRYEGPVVPGRAEYAGTTMQFALPGAVDADDLLPAPKESAPVWLPSEVTGVVARPGSVRALLEGLRRDGMMVAGVDDAVPLLDGRTAGFSAAPIAIVGDAESWQRGWRVLGTIRSDHDLLIDARCAGDYRSLTGERDLPPYCTPGRGRAWLHAGGAVARVQAEVWG